MSSSLLRSYQPLPFLSTSPKHLLRLIFDLGRRMSLVRKVWKLRSPKCGTTELNELDGFATLTLGLRDQSIGLLFNKACLPAASVRLPRLDAPLL